MGVKDKMRLMDEKAIYVKASMFHQDVRVARIDNKTHIGQKSNCVFLKYKPGLVLQFYGDADFQNFDDDIKEYNEELLKGNDWFVVSYGKIGTNFVTKQLDAARVKQFDYEMLDPAKHEITAGEGTTALASPCKKMKTL